MPEEDWEGKAASKHKDARSPPQLEGKVRKIQILTESALVEKMNAENKVGKHGHRTQNHRALRED